LNISIDTNILLDFYHLTNESLDELRNILVLNKLGAVSITLSEQIKDEFFRNREVKIDDALKRFKEEKLNNQIPQMVKDFGEFTDFQKTLKDYQLNKDKIIQKIEENVKNQSLKADEIIRQLFEKAIWVDVSEAILSRAKIRYDRGNPPGKNNSYGDAIVWETLLQSINEGEDLHFITDDKDYYSPITSNEANQFLKQEWTAKKKSQLLIYKRPSQFMASNFKDAIKAIELEQEYLVNQLFESGAFATTHSVIASLNKYDHFSKSSVAKIVESYTENSQVYWISEDEDVQMFLRKFVANHSKDIDADKLKELQDMIVAE